MEDGLVTCAPRMCRELKISKQQAAIADEEARAGLPLRSQLQEVSARVLELEALQRQADEDKGDLLDYIQVSLMT